MSSPGPNLTVPGSPGMSRAPSILISPRMGAVNLGSSVFGNGNSSAASATLNSLATLAPSQEKLTKLEMFAPREEENLKMFDKTLSSDVNQEEAVALLQKIDEKTSLFREFTYHDISYLAQVLTILKFQPGDVIIEAGEESSFVGMILSGELQVKFGDVVKPIPEGSLLGELSFFEGGTRTAAVSAGGTTESIVGMLTFNELEQLAEYAPTIRLKLMVLFALEGIKKMRLFSKPPPTPGSEAEAAAKAKEAEANTPYNQSKPPINKRMSGTIGSELKLNSSGSQKSLPAPAQDDSKPSSETGGRNRSLKRVGSLVRDALNLAPGTLNEKAAPAVPSATAPPPTVQARNVEALFRIRMKNEQKAQQEKIEKALEKRKNAEHKAKTTSVMADAFRRDLDKKQEFIEELYQENLDLKEYKEWAKKKHIADAKFLKEKLEISAELQTQLSMETEKRKAQEKANEEVYKQMDSLVSARTKSYVESIEELQRDCKKLQVRLEAGEKLRSTLEENLSLAAKQKQLDESRIADTLKSMEDLKLSLQQQGNEVLIQHLRQVNTQQEEIGVLKKLVKELEEKHAVLLQWKEESIEHSLQKEMLHQRLHRNLLENVDKHSALISDVQAYKIILKYLLASVLVKNYRRRKHLKSMFLEQTDMLRKLNIEVAHYSNTGGGGGGGSNAGTGGTGKSGSRTSNALATLPKGTVHASGSAGIVASGAMTIAQGMDLNEDGTLVVNYDESYDASAGSGTGNGDSSSPTNLFDRRSSGTFSGLGSGVHQPGGVHLGNARSFAEKAKQDQLFIRLNDLLPTLRTLIDEICSQKIYWNATADSFFRRTIELKQQIMDFESSGGTAVVRTGGHTGGVIGTPKENVSLTLTNSKGDPFWNSLAGGEGREYHSQLEAANTVQPRSNFQYQESKEESSGTNSRSGQNKKSRLFGTGGNSPAPEASGGEEDETEHLKPPRSSGAGGRRGSGSHSPSQHHPQSLSELRDTREKMVYYKRKTKEYKEINAMLSTKVQSFAARLQELEEWQRNLYAHSSAATAAGLLGPFQAAPLPPVLPPVLGATALHPSQTLKAGSGAGGGSKHVTPVHVHHVGSYAASHGTSPSPGAALGVGPTAILMTGGTLGENPYLHDFRGGPNGGANGGGPSSAKSAPLDRSSLNGPSPPVFHIKGGNGGSGGGQAYAAAGNASPLTALYASLPTAPANNAPSNPVALVLKRPMETSNSGQSAPSQNFLIQSSASQRNQEHFLLGSKDGSSTGQTSSQQPQSSHQQQILQPKPPSTTNYMQHQMSAYQRYGNGSTVAPPLLVFPSTPPPQQSGSQSARQPGAPAGGFQRTQPVYRQ